MTLDPLSVHEHFRCNRSAFEGLEHYYKPRVEVKVNPHIDWGEFSMDDFVNEIVKPGTTRMKATAEAWERHLLEEAYRLCVWRISYVSWYEWLDCGTCHCYTRVWPASQTKQALKFAREKGEHVVTLNFKTWILMSDEEFFCKTHGSANYETALKLRKLLKPIIQRKCR
jgi:hypothetical protein